MTNEIPKIPANDSEYFIFKKSEKMTSIIILFDHTSFLNIKNLFIIIKIYVTNKENLLKNIYILGDDSLNNFETKKIPIFHVVSLKFLERMNFYDFESWYEETYDQNYKYIQNVKYYGVQFQFYGISTNWANCVIYPKFPISSNLEDVFFKRTESFVLKKKINNLLKENIKLKKKIKDIRKKR